MTQMSPTLQRLLAQLGPGQQLEFRKLEEAIAAAKYTGITVHHWLNGRLRQIDLGAPIRLSIIEGLDNKDPSDGR